VQFKQVGGEEGGRFTEEYHTYFAGKTHGRRTSKRELQTRCRGSSWCPGSGLSGWGAAPKHAQIAAATLNSTIETGDTQRQSAGSLDQRGTDLFDIEYCARAGQI